MKLIHISSTIAAWILVSATLLASNLDKPEAAEEPVVSRLTTQPIEAKADQSKPVKVKCVFRNIDFSVSSRPQPGRETWVLFNGYSDKDGVSSSIGKMPVPQCGDGREFSLDVPTPFLQLSLTRMGRRSLLFDINLTEKLETSSLSNKVLQIDIRGPYGEPQVLDAGSYKSMFELRGLSATEPTTGTSLVTKADSDADAKKEIQTSSKKEGASCSFTLRYLNFPVGASVYLKEMYGESETDCDKGQSCSLVPSWMFTCKDGISKITRAENPYIKLILQFNIKGPEFSLGPVHTSSLANKNVFVAYYPPEKIGTLPECRWGFLSFAK